jgi:hypothetical protein
MKREPRMLPVHEPIAPRENRKSAASYQHPQRNAGLKN